MLKEDFEKIGFKGIKIWEQTMNFMYKTGEEYYEKMGNSRLKSQLYNLNASPEKLLEIKNDLIN